MVSVGTYIFIESMLKLGKEMLRKSLSVGWQGELISDLLWNWAWLLFDLKIEDFYKLYDNSPFQKQKILNPSQSWQLAFFSSSWDIQGLLNFLLQMSYLSFSQQLRVYFFSNAPVFAIDVAVTFFSFVLFVPLFQLADSRSHAEDRFVYFLVVQVDLSLLLGPKRVANPEGTLKLVVLRILMVSTERALTPVWDWDKSVDDGVVVVVDLVRLEMREVSIVGPRMCEFESARSGWTHFGFNRWTCWVNIFLMDA